MDEQSSLQRFLKDDLFRWKLFVVHFVLFGVSMLLGGWTIVGSTTVVYPGSSVTSTSQLILYPISLIWLCIVTLHFCFTLLNEKGRVKQKQLAEKPKRHFLEVGDDGELIEVMDSVEDEAALNCQTRQG